MGEARASISQIPDLLDQLDWLTAELEAQRPFLARLPDVQIKTSPLPGVPSLLDMYREMVVRERDVHFPALNLQDSDVHAAMLSTDAGLDEMIVQLVAMRSTIVDRLSALTQEEWVGKPMGPSPYADVITLAFEITQSDGDSLRAIAERMREGQTALG